MRRVLLDNQIWNHLARPETGPANGISLVQLRGAVRSAAIELVGSFDLMQEMVATAARDPEKMHLMVELLLEFAGDRVLLPLNLRIPAEAEFGGLLPEDQRYADRDWLVESFNALSAADLLEMADAAYQEGLSFEAKQEQIRSDVKAELDEKGQRSTGAVWRRWFAKRDIEEEVELVIRAGLEQGDFALDLPVSEFGEDRFPSAAAFMDAMNARAVLSIGEGRRIQGSDLGDVHHLAAGPYIDVFVTEDKGLREAVSLIGSRRTLGYESPTSAEFAAELSAVPPVQTDR